MKKIKCCNRKCRHYIAGGYCKECIVTLDGSGKCKSFEKGFTYYFHLVWEALGSKNYIDYIEIQRNPDLRIGLYYVADCYGLGFVEKEWGTCRMLLLQDGENGKPLNYMGILERKINMEKFMKHRADFENGIMPGQNRESMARQQEAEPKEFGWLSPAGKFTESPFGEHEESAGQICRSKGFMDEYWEWRKARKDGDRCQRLMRDFLQQIKGYCLIHNPAGDGGYIVTNMKNLTKKQKEFLYGYFMDMGDRFKAEQFVE